MAWLGNELEQVELSECLWARLISPVWLEVNMRQVTGMTGMTSSGLSGLSTSRLGGGALERPFVPGTMAKTLPLPLGSIHPSRKKTKTIHYIFNHVKLRARSFTNISRKECTRRGGGKTGFFFFFFVLRHQTIQEGGGLF